MLEPLFRGALFAADGGCRMIVTRAGSLHEFRVLESQLDDFELLHFILLKFGLSIQLLKLRIRYVMHFLVSDRPTLQI